MKNLLLIFNLVMACSISYAQPLPDSLLKAFHIRSVGPAGMSGRITAIDVVLRDPAHIYIGSASGGVWESTDGGIDWKPIFDEQPTLAIGALKINQQNPKEIWVGTGEGNPRNSQNSGKGIFRSLDGGRSWMGMGLTETKTIHRIWIDPHQPSTVYVGAMGSAWGPNEERGVFKTTDSGKTWTKILYANDRTGVGDLVMDPHNPRKLIAAMYEYGRTPWDFKSGGPGSGLHMTYDGGETWKKITSENGLPKGELGRIGIAIAASKPHIVYALVEAKENGLYKSTDGGENWSLVSTKNIGNRPFYYHEIYVDPKNENRIWNLYSVVSKSEDGGKSFESVLNYGSGIHPDHHAFWIHPDEPDFMIDGNDGGLNISRDGGDNWMFCENIPVGQFYHINIDHDYPYNLYGGMQDNGSWVGPAYVLKSGGIRNYDWRELYFGDGFDVVPKLSDTRYGWAMSQGGYLTYYDRETGFNQFARPVHPEGVQLRFNWNAAIAAVPGEDCGIYYGSQFVHRSVDCGKSWQIISPDLTTNDTTKQKQNESGGLTIDATTAENHTTILCIAPNALNPDVIWVGTDDGNLQLTRDGGKTWTNLSDRLPGCPRNAWIPQIEVSSYQAGEAFVVVNHYRRNDWSAYAYHTTDYGITWSRIADDKQISSFVLSIVQDPVVPHLLFLGADDGLYLSIDKGKQWTRFPGKAFPRTPVSDMKIHPAEHSLAIGTFGRSFWVLDNLLPLREIAKERAVLDKPFKLYPSIDAIQASYRSVDGVRFTADAEFKGDNKPGGARFHVYVKPAEKRDTTKMDLPEVKVKGRKKNEIPDDTTAIKAMPKDTSSKKEDKTEKDLLKLYVLDQKGDTIRYINQKLKEGWGMVNWDLRAKGVRFPSRNEPSKDADDPPGEYVQPGTFKVIGTYNQHKDSTQVVVRLDPRLDITAEHLSQRNEVVREFQKEVRWAQESFKALQDIRKDMKMMESMMSNAPDSLQDKIKDRHKELNKRLSEIEKQFMEPENVKGYTNAINLGTYLGGTNSYLNTSLGSPGRNAMDMLALTKMEVGKAVKSVNEFIEKDWNDYQIFIGEWKWPVFKDIEIIQKE
jgi:photosystem II stability/assembly factor-like uncharacterized protein